MAPNGTSTGHNPPLAGPPVRVDWVDYAKGICIVMVVMMHSVLGVEAAAGQTGFMHWLVMFAKPFRMPDFFLISGLFLSVVIDRDWRTYLDRKVVHFAYFYLLWVTIQFGFKAPSFAANGIGTMSAICIWNPSSNRSARCGFFICCDFFVVTKLTRRAAADHDLDCRRGAGNGAFVHRLDRDRRVLRALRLFLFRLLAGRPASSRVNRARARPVAALAGLALWAAGQWRPRPLRLQRMADRLVGARVCRRLRHHRDGHAAGARAVAQCPALLR